MSWLFSSKAFLVTSSIMFYGGIIFFTLSQLRIVGEGEPLFVLQLSNLAIIASGYGNIISSRVNKKLEE